MLIRALAPPSADFNAAEQVDWLELAAFLSEHSVARLDELVGSLTQQEEAPEDNIEVADNLHEQLIEDIENEITLRERSLEGAYPFHLSDDAEELTIDDDWQQIGPSLYLVCLLTSHISASSILTPPRNDERFNELVQRLRNRVFQVVSTLAAAGLSGGSAVSVGWPRIRGEPILEVLTRAKDRGAGFTPRDVPGVYAPPQARDGGIDVISWTAEVIPPPANVYFAQAASGRNWRGKSVRDFVENFVRNYMVERPRSNISHTTIIPFRVFDELIWQDQHSVHGALQDRLRTPANALLAYSRSLEGDVMDEAAEAHTVPVWLNEMRELLTGAA